MLHEPSCVIYVVSFLEWGWALTLRQLGALRVLCVPASAQASTLLQALRQLVPGLTAAVELRKSPWLVTAHVHSIEQLQALEHRGVGQATKLMLSCAASCWRGIAHALHKGLFPDHTAWQRLKLSHSDLGGLTDLRCCFFWSDRSDVPSAMTELQSSEVYEITRRRPEGFLEPSIRLSEWLPCSDATAIQGVNGNDVGLRITSTVKAWDPRRGYLPLPVCSWQWVIAPTVFLDEKVIARPLSAKEKSQILDVREDWQQAAAITWSTLSTAPAQITPFPTRFGSTILLHLFQWWKQPSLPSQVSPLGWQRARLLPQSISTTHLRNAGLCGALIEPLDAVGVTVACKADAAAIDTSLWNIGGDSESAVRARSVLQRFFHRVWYDRLHREAWQWWDDQAKAGRSASDLKKSKARIQDCLLRARRSTWFEWSDGSCPYFWRWPSDIRWEVRDGSVIFHKYIPAKRPSAREITGIAPWMSELMDDKLRKFFSRRYIHPVPRSLIRVAIVYFPVSKGDDDIRVVWSETETGVNDSVFAPHFFLPSSGTLFRRVPNNAYMGDFDIGEQFNNYLLPEAERPYHGVLLSKHLQTEFKCEAAVWGRLPMGFRPSPYLAGRLTSRAIEFAKGDPRTPGNPFGFAKVVLNLPMSPSYDPTLGLRVLKLTENDQYAGEVIVYADDGRTVGRDEPHSQACTRVCCSRLEYLGIQDAKRKRRPESQRPGVWAGAALYTDDHVVRKFLPQRRWEKAKDLIARLSKDLRERGGFDTAFFLSARGFLVYASLTYTFVVPFLKGLHLTADAWRSGRDNLGWKAKERLPPQSDDEDEDDRLFDLRDESTEPTPPLGFSDDDIDIDWTCFTPDIDLTEAPSFLRAVPRLSYDLSALERFFESDAPLMIPRSSRTLCLAYGFGDASGEGFGSYFATLTSNGSTGQARLRRGFWCTSISEKSSNYREFRNLVDAVKDAHASHGLEGYELWLFSDNEVTEGVYYKGTSQDPELFGLMLELRLLALNAGFSVHIVHIAGTRMIQQGTDGLSRGELHIGNFLDPTGQVVPLHLGAMERSPSLLEWVRHWTGLDEKKLRVAEPVDWPYAAHFPTHIWIWAPPPAAALYAMEELALARLKRADHTLAIVMIPLLLKPEWFRRFSRSVDVYFVVRPNHTFWGPSMHEPLLIGICFPLLSCEPWAWKNAEFMVGLGRTLSAVHKKDSNAGRDLLRKFWSARARTPYLPKNMVRKLLLRPSFNAFLGLSRC